MRKIKKTKILITGVAGYIGSKLATELIKNQNNIIYGVDIFKYDRSSLNHLYCENNFKFINMDASIEKNIKILIEGVDIIIPLAGLVGAPLCEKNKSEAIKINLKAIKLIIKHVKKNQKIIYPTTNSGYGVGKKNAYCDELTPLNPISLYGRTKTEAEKYVMSHKNSISFRLATVFGCSFRMRSDLLVNNFVYTAINKKKLDIYEPHFRRNYIHINDIVKAFVFSIKNFNKLRSNVYNLGLSSANITKLDLANLVKSKLIKTKVTVIKNKKDPDQRDYFVSNKKIESKGFIAKTKLEDGIEELIKFFKNSKIKIKNNY